MKSAVPVPPTSAPPGYLSNQQQSSTWNSQQLAAAQQYASHWGAQQAQNVVQQYTSKLAQSGQKCSEATYQQYYQHYYQYYYQHYYSTYFSQLSASNTAHTATTAPIASPKATPSPTYASALMQGVVGAANTNITSLHAAAAAKKPNMSRFTGSASSTSVITSAAVPTKLAGAAAQNLKGNGSESSGSKDCFSTALNQFMIRAFETCKSDADRDAMRLELRKLVDRVTATGQLLRHDWANEAVPLCGKQDDTKSSPGPPASHMSGSLKSSSAGSWSSLVKSSQSQSQENKRPASIAFTKTQQSSSSTPEEESPANKRKKTRWTNVTEDKAESNKPTTTSATSNTTDKLLSPPAQSSVSEVIKTNTKYTNQKISPKEASKETNKNTTKAAGISTLQLSSQEMMMREKRANRFQSDEMTTSSSIGLSTTESMITSNNTQGLSKKDLKKAKKRGRMKGGSYEIYGGGVTTGSNKSTSSTGGGGGAGGGMTDEEMNSLRIVGTCQRLEKDYFRLTSAPDPSSVRPERILRKTLDLLKSKWAEEGANAVDYVYLCNQLKSMRQDLTVQHIQNDLTVSVYEFHARSALESEDLNEYNQCQTQLKQLYEKGLAPLSSVYEFTAYRILYYVCVQGGTKNQRGNTDISALLVSLSDDAKSHAAIKHALALRSAVQQYNYHRMFKLYSEAPNHGGLIIDMVLSIWRGKALQRMMKAYKPQVSTDFIISELVFDTEEEGSRFIVKAGGVFTDKTEKEIDTKLSVIDMSKVVEKDKLLL